VPTHASHARQLILSGGIPVVAALWCHEASNGVVIAERRGRLTAEQIETLTEDLDDFSDIVQIDPVFVRSWY